MRTFLAVVFILLAAVAAAAYSSAFIVPQGKQALVLRFGEAQEPLRDQPGLYWKMPLIDNVEEYDKRILDIDLPTKTVTTLDQKYLLVNSFARYRIDSPLLVRQRVEGTKGINGTLEPIIAAAMGRVLGSHNFIDVVRDKREELMKEITRQVNTSGKYFGLDVVDVRIKRTDLPEQNSKSVFERMRAARQRQSTEFRAMGAAESNRIRATADREVTVIKAEATKNGEQLRGEGDAERNRIFAEAFGQDPDFFGFYRSMQAYEAGLKPSETRMIMSPDSEFFKYFSNPNGAPSPPKQ